MDSCDAAWVEKAMALSPLESAMTEPVRASPNTLHLARRSSWMPERGASVVTMIMHDPSGVYLPLNRHQKLNYANRPGVGR
jgi:hypothetical protein